MKVKNIAFSGFMAAILMGATGANAALNVASTDYVDAKTGAVATTVSNLQSAIDTKFESYYTAEQTDAKYQTIAQAALDAKAASDYTDQEIKKLSATIGGSVDPDTGEQTGGITATVTEHGQKITALEGRADTLESDVDALETLVGTTSVASQIAAAVLVETNARTSADTTMQGEIDAVEGRATALEGLVGTTAVATQISDAISASEATTEAAYKEYVDTSFGELNTNVATKQEELGADNVIQNGTGVVKTVVADDGTLTATASLVATADIDDNAVTTAKIADGNVTTAKIADGNVTDAKIASVDQAKVSGLTNAAGETVSLAAALTSKITMPEVCEKTTCVLTVDSASGTVTWAPLFTADDATSGS